MIKRLKVNLNDQGSGLIVILILVAILGIIVYSAVGFTTGHSKLAWFNYKRTDAHNLAESNLEIGISKLVGAVRKVPFQADLQPLTTDTSGFVYPAPAANEFLTLETAPDGFGHDKIVAATYKVTE